MAKRSMRLYGLLGGSMVAAGTALVVASIVVVVRAIILP
jgi:hypothetical protein